MEIFSDAFAGWAFSLSHKLKNDDFSTLLELLRETEVLMVNKISSLHDEEEMVGGSVLSDSLLKSNHYLSFTGKTRLCEDTSNLYLEDVVTLLYEPSLNLLSLDIYSDAWMPIGLYGNLQIDSGIANFELLKKTLELISKLDFVEKITPSEGEYLDDYIARQIGFDLFYKCNIDDIKGLTEEQRVKVAPFILPD